MPAGDVGAPRSTSASSTARLDASGQSSSSAPSSSTLPWYDRARSNTAQAAAACTGTQLCLSRAAMPSRPRRLYISQAPSFRRSSWSGCMAMAAGIAARPPEFRIHCRVAWLLFPMTCSVQSLSNCTSLPSPEAARPRRRNSTDSWQRPSMPVRSETVARPMTPFSGSCSSWEEHSASAATAASRSELVAPTSSAPAGSFVSCPMARAVY
mmetsp:Transcript_55036/g.154812  ORF Transcript_55036/g.154812 Transcript_55036/m.154812 type:complete len:210 (+) Transcript_55036:462-1091(+)